MVNDEFCAIKRIPLDETKLRDLHSIDRQAEIMKRCDNCHIMKLLDSFEYNGKYYIITSYAEKGDLFEFTQNKGRLSEWSAAYVMKQLFEGLSYLHNEKHIVHSDIKMENIVMDNKNMIKITDFGFAYEFSDSSQKKRQVVGTPTYLAPENWEGDYSIASDMWASGILLCNLLFIKLSEVKTPEKSEHISENLKQYAQSNDDSQKIFLKNLLETRHISDLCKQFICKLLRKNPDERINASEALNDPWIKKYSIAGLVE